MQAGKSSPRVTTSTTSVPGLAARRVAADILDGTLWKSRSLDEQFDGAGRHPGLAELPERDRALTRAIVAAVVRRLGTLGQILSVYLDRGAPAKAPRVKTALLIGAAQILFLDVPDHAAVDLSVRLVQADRHAARYAGLTNAVLRRVVREGPEYLKTLDVVALDTPPWLLARWVASYGEATARAIATANGHEAALDLSVKSDPAVWAERLGGRVLPTGSVRTVAHGSVTALPGFAEGAWWVQDAAAALPAQLLGAVDGRRVADLCAAPGGKAAQLAAMGAQVTAVDRSPARVDRMRGNLHRLALTADLVCADVTAWTAEPFDAVLVDAPCSSTGTIRRHPDIPWLKRESDIAALAGLQRRLIQRAAALTKPGCVLVYCTCSLEPEEGEDIVSDLLAREPAMRRSPITPAEIFGCADFITENGDLRTLPCQLADSDSRFSGLDGFYAARLVKQ